MSVFCSMLVLYCSMYTIFLHILMGVLNLIYTCGSVAVILHDEAAVDGKRNARPLIGWAEKFVKPPTGSVNGV